MTNINQDRLKACKLFMKVDIDADDDLIAELMETAVEYLKAAGIPESWSYRFTLAVKSLTLFWYDHRADVSTDKVMPPGLRPLINQLKADGYADSAASAQEAV